MCELLCFLDSQNALARVLWYCRCPQEYLGLRSTCSAARKALPPPQHFFNEEIALLSAVDQNDLGLCSFLSSSRTNLAKGIALINAINKHLGPIVRCIMHNINQEDGAVPYRYDARLEFPHNGEWPNHKHECLLTQALWGLCKWARQDLIDELLAQFGQTLDNVPPYHFFYLLHVCGDGLSTTIGAECLRRTLKIATARNFSHIVDVALYNAGYTGRLELLDGLLKDKRMAGSVPSWMRMIDGAIKAGRTDMIFYAISKMPGGLTQYDASTILGRALQYKKKSYISLALALGAERYIYPADAFLKADISFLDWLQHSYQSFALERFGDIPHTSLRLDNSFAMFILSRVLPCPAKLYDCGIQLSAREFAIKQKLVSLGITPTEPDVFRKSLRESDISLTRLFVSAGGKIYHYPMYIEHPGFIRKLLKFPEYNRRPWMSTVPVARGAFSIDFVDFPCL